jgi:DNA replication protein DnaC
MHYLTDSDSTQALSHNSDTLSADIDARRLALEEELRIQKIQRYSFGHGGNGAPGFQTVPVAGWDWCSTDSPEFKQRVSKKFQAFAKSYAGNVSAVLLGPTGRGKTSAALAAVKRIKATAESVAIENPTAELQRIFGLHQIAKMRWHSGSQIALARKQHALGKGEAELITDAIQASLLVIDEVGFEPLDGALFDVVDGRYMRQKPTVITSGLAPEAFKAKYGDALWRRLTERGAIVEDFK